MDRMDRAHSVPGIGRGKQKPISAPAPGRIDAVANGPDNGDTPSVASDQNFIGKENALLPSLEEARVGGHCFFGPHGEVFDPEVDVTATLSRSTTAGLDWFVLAQLCQRFYVDFSVNRQKRIRLTGSYDCLTAFAAEIKAISKPASRSENLGCTRTHNADSDERNTDLGKSIFPPKDKNSTDTTQSESISSLANGETQPLPQIAGNCTDERTLQIFSSPNETQQPPQALGSNATQSSPTATPTIPDSLSHQHTDELPYPSSALSQANKQTGPLHPKIDDLDNDNGCEARDSAENAESPKSVAPPFQLNSLTVEYVRKVRCGRLDCIEKEHGVWLSESTDSSLGTSMVSVKLLSDTRGTTSSKQALEDGHRKVRELCTEVSQLRFAEKKIPIPSGKTGLVNDLLKESLRPSETRCLIEVNDQTKEVSLYGTQDDVKTTTEILSRMFTKDNLESCVPAIAAQVNDDKRSRAELLAKDLEYDTKCGNIAEENVDVVVCGINADMNLQGGAAKAVCIAVGGDLEKNCKKYLKEKTKTKFGEVVILPVEKQPFSYVAFAVIHGGKSQKSLKGAVGHGQSLTEIFFRCLERATEVKARSIAVPALGCGYGLKTEKCVKTMLSTVYRFLETFGAKCSLVKIVFIDKDEAVRQEFEKELSKMKQQNESLSVSKPAPRTASLTKAPIPVNFDKSNERDRAESRSNSTSVDHYSGAGTVTASASKPVEHQCAICLNPPAQGQKTVLKCGHTFCKQCIDKWFKEKPTCPSCGETFGKVTGTQPDGTMTVSSLPSSLPGYSDCGTIHILYTFPSGIQTERHPNPGIPYDGTVRSAFLPENEEGREVLRLLRKAFDAKLTFTVGRSRTTGEDDRITWNDVHHKTKKKGGPQNFGYPDPAYLSRVRDELEAKGIK